MRSPATPSTRRNDPQARSTSGARWPRGTLLAVTFAAVAAVVAAALGQALLDDGRIVWRAALLAAAGGGLLLWLAAKHLAAASFGLANLVTLGRGALTLLLLALLGAPASAVLGWLIAALAIVAVTLDGVDGKLARDRNEASDFGARFDMETDALLILVLAALVWQLDKAGAWILLAGLLRYLFVGASYVWSWLERPLPPSRRRQTVCVLQIASLIGALAPLVAPPWSALVALLGLLLLAWSFAVDVAWLARRAGV
jgi:phosphatidylglycerophosphate synthase